MFPTSEKEEMSFDFNSSQELEAEISEVSMRRLFAMNSPEWHFMLVGCLAAFFNGLIDTGNAFLFVKIFAVCTSTLRIHLTWLESPV